MRVRALSILLMLFIVAPASERAFAQSERAAGAQPLDVSAQTRTTRARTRIRVRPGYPYRLISTPYPVPYEYEYPGPGAVRECRSWLATEHRPSGTVITPRMRCWWER